MQYERIPRDTNVKFLILRIYVFQWTAQKCKVMRKLYKIVYNHSSTSMCLRVEKINSPTRNSLIKQRNLNRSPTPWLNDRNKACTIPDTLINSTDNDRPNHLVLSSLHFTKWYRSSNSGCAVANNSVVRNSSHEMIDVNSAITFLSCQIRWNYNTFEAHH